ncbi:MAG: hypothetical protein ACI8P3_004322 [Saprospiraceae bacterium]|jgi:hypothetical protein
MIRSLPRESQTDLFDALFFKPGFSTPKTKSHASNHR